MKQTIGEFLLRRLEEVGIRHTFGVPGGYNLEFMQQLWGGNMYYALLCLDKPGNGELRKLFVQATCSFSSSTHPLSDSEVH